MNKAKLVINEYKSKLIIGPLFKLIEAIIEVIIPIIIANVIDNIFIYNINEKIKIGAIILIITIIGYICACISQYLAAEVSQKIGRKLRLDLFKHIFKISNDDIDRIGPLAIVNRLTNDIFNIEMAIAMWIRLVIRVPFICISSLIMIGIINLKIAFIVLCSTILFSLLILFIVKITVPFYKIANNELDKLLIKTKEEFVNIKLIRSFGTENRELKKFENINRKNYKFYNKANMISSLLSPITGIILNMTIILILYIGDYQIKLNMLTQGELIAIINYVTQILVSVIIFSNLISIYTKAFSSLNRINYIFNIKEEKKYGNIEKINEKNNIIIKFKNVSFSHNENKLLFDNINIDIKKGDIVGIIGPISSGKTTFLELINRSYIPDSGNIYLGGIDLLDYTNSCVKKNIKLIEQNPVFLTDTIRNNVKLSCSVDDNEIIKSIHLSEAEEFINKKLEGLNYVLKNNANNLSGGQKQRIALSRMFIGNPKIILLDNITSALDYKTESIVIDNIINYVIRNNITLLIASQKINTVKKCKRILVFDNGSIIGYGNHEELLKNCSLYKYINEIQN